MRNSVFALAGLLLSVASGPAHAGVLATAPALAAYPALQTIYCDIVNLNTSDKNVTIDIMDYFGNVVTTTGSFALPPSQGNALGDGTGQGTWCRFTVDGSARKYRGMAIYDNGSAYTVSVPAF
jgi:hypothetical protein